MCFICVWGSFTIFWSEFSSSMFSTSHRRCRTEQWIGRTQGNQCHNNVFLVPRVRVAIPFSRWTSLFQVRHGLLPSKEHCLGDIVFTKHVCLFQRALLRRHGLSKGICQAVLSGEQESLLSVGWARGRWDISQALLQTAVSSLPLMYMYAQILNRQLKGWGKNTYHDSISKASKFLLNLPWQ